MSRKRYGIVEATQDILAKSLSSPIPATHGLRHQGIPPEQAEFIRQVGASMPKLVRGKQIADEVYAKWNKIAKESGATGQNDRYDAMRHAEWMHRTAEELSPEFARLVGFLHEVFGRGDRYSHSMDHYNNEIAVHAAEAGHPYILDDLQTGRWEVPKRMEGALGHYMKDEHLPWPVRQRMQIAPSSRRRGSK